MHLQQSKEKRCKYLEKKHQKALYRGRKIDKKMQFILRVVKQKLKIYKYGGYFFKKSLDKKEKAW